MLTSCGVSADYTGDFAIVQSANFSTLFVLSRQQHLEESVLDVSQHTLVTGDMYIQTRFADN